MSITVSDFAVEKIKNVLVEQNKTTEGTYLRIGVKTSCSGSSYNFGLIDSSEYNEESDFLVKEKEVSFVFNKKYVNDLFGVIIDYKDAEDEKGFTFKSPLISSGCCGGSCGNKEACSN